MKKTLIIALQLGCALGAFAQGSVNFNNRFIGATAATTVVAPIYGPESDSSIRLSGNATTNGGSTVYSGTLLTGTGFTAQLWGGSPGGSLSLLSSTHFRTNAAQQVTFAGFVQPPATAPTVNGQNGAPMIAGGSPADFQVRVWNNQGGTVTSWAAAMAMQETVAHGVSGIISVSALGTPPGTPPNLLGMQSFNLAVVPEPSVIALGALGLGALLLRRRK